MSIEFAGYSFEGPYTDTVYLKDEPGVYVILDQRSDSLWYALDVGESTQVKTRIENHDRKECWDSNQLGTRGYAVLYTPGWTDDQRRTLEQEVREKLSPPCGEQ